jgi:hypothetical protein
MIRWKSIADRGAMALVAVLCVAAARPLVAQQDSLPAPQAGAGAAQASSASTSPTPSLAGPRLRPEWRRVEPVFPRGTTAGPMAASGGTTTITVTTLVLVLLIIIVVLLV